MKVKLNHKSRSLTLCLEEFESQAIHDVLKDGVEDDTKIVCYLSSNTLTICRESDIDFREVSR